MESEKYREFLKKRAENRPLYKNILGEKIIFEVSKEEREEKHQRGSSDILESILLGREIGRNVTVDREAASFLQYRLDMLEEENAQMRRRMRFMKIMIVFLAFSTFVTFAYMIMRLI
ncbi:hypothetical protein CW705_09660 [Candidatus Bathyarchaeota archaeon]|nr:MAG: hypothetical protein CW705_09660 [Candidatus Bathyarchaeota archaeon]